MYVCVCTLNLRGRTCSSASSSIICAWRYMFVLFPRLRNVWHRHWFMCLSTQSQVVWLRPARLCQVRTPRSPFSHTFWTNANHWRTSIFTTQRAWNKSQPPVMDCVLWFTCWVSSSSRPSSHLFTALALGSFQPQVWEMDREWDSHHMESFTY